MDAAPYLSASEHLNDYFSVLVWLFRAFYAEQVFSLRDPGDPLRVLDFTEAFYPPLLQPPQDDSAGAASAQLCLEQARQAQELIQRRLRATVEQGVEVLLPLEELRGAFGLDEPALQALVALALLDCNPTFDEVYRRAAPQHEARPGLGRLIQWLHLDQARARALLAQLSEPSPLVALGAVLPLEERGAPRPRMLRPLSVAPAALRFLLEPPAPQEAAEAPQELVLPPEARKKLAWATRQRGPRAVLLLGPRGSGRRSLLASMAQQLGHALIALDPEEAASPEQVVELVRAGMLQARLRNAWLLIRAEALRPEPAQRQALLALLRAWDQPVFFTAASWEAFALHGWGQPLRVDFGVLSTEALARVWELALARAGLRSHRPALEMAARFRSTPGAIVQAVERVSRELPSGQVVPGGAWLEAFQESLQGRLGTVASLMETPLRWEDLVVDPELEQRLQEVIAHARHYAQVYEAWNFKSKVPYGRGLTMLFYGPPGTGKTMAATLIAKSLSRPLYRVDLSRTVDKYIGETEKNLARLFDEADRSQAILLFDEADSLFASRTKVGSATDRYANLEVNFLLQRMEHFEGVSVLTSNNENLMDEAFRRRIRFKLYFAAPEAPERARIWRVCLPGEVSLAGELDFDKLGRDFPLSGGHIKAAVLRAAFLAASQGRGLLQEDLRQAAQMECRELGILTPQKSPRE